MIYEPQILNIDALLKPIEGNSRGGPYLLHKDDESYIALMEARQMDENPPEGALSSEIKVANWPKIVQIATKILATKSKDLEIAVWLIEALVKHQGFSGLCEGLHLLTKFLEVFWHDLHPGVEEGELDLDYRAAPLENLCEDLPFWIRSVPLSQDTEGENYDWWQWQAIQEREMEGVVEDHVFDQAVASTPTDFYTVTRRNLSRCQDACERLSQILDEKFGAARFNLSDIIAALQDCYMIIDDVLQQRSTEDAPEITLEANSDAKVNATLSEDKCLPLPGDKSQTLTPSSRADALHRLEIIAAYLNQTEPLSPIACLIQRAVRWGKMPLDQWLREVIRNESVLEELQDILGLNEMKVHEH